MHASLLTAAASVATIRPLLFGRRLSSRCCLRLCRCRCSFFCCPTVRHARPCPSESTCFSGPPALSVLPNVSVWSSFVGLFLFATAALAALRPLSSHHCSFSGPSGCASAAVRPFRLLLSFFHVFGRFSPLNHVRPFVRLLELSSSSVDVCGCQPVRSWRLLSLSGLASQVHFWLACLVVLRPFWPFLSDRPTPSLASLSRPPSSFFFIVVC